MVLVEEGPWSEPIEDQLTRVQGRLYDCIDAALDGKLAEKFPESAGKNIVIQLDAYNLPRERVSEFFESFSEGIFLIDDYKTALVQSSFVKSISFEANFDAIH